MTQKSQNSFARIPTTLIEELAPLKGDALKVMVVLLQRCDWRTGCFVTCAAPLGKLTGLSARSAQRILRKLELGGYITRKLPKNGSPEAYPIWLANFRPTLGKDREKTLRPTKTTAPPVSGSAPKATATPPPVSQTPSPVASNQDDKPRLQIKHLDDETRSQTRKPASLKTGDRLSAGVHDLPSGPDLTVGHSACTECTSPTLRAVPAIRASVTAPTVSVTARAFTPAEEQELARLEKLWQEAPNGSEERRAARNRFCQARREFAAKCPAV